MVCTFFSVFYPIVSISRGNIRADFSAQRRSFYFSVRETRECYNIHVTNDDTQEDTEMFTVTVNRTSSLDPRIRLEDNVAVVSIIDADSERGKGREGETERLKHVNIQPRLS